MNIVGRKMSILFFAVLSAVLLTASFPKIGWEWMIWFALIPLLSVVNHRSPGLAFRIGWLAGVVHFLSLLYWLTPTMRTFGHIPLILAILVLLLFAAYLGLYTAMFAWLTVYTRPNPILLPVMVPLFWTAMELGRATLFTGFPWALLGHSQFERLPVIQIADITGVYGISFLIAMVNASLWIAYLKIAGRSWFGREIRTFHVVLAAGLAISAFAGVFAYGLHRMEAIDRHVASSEKIRVAIIQGNVDQTVKWNPAFRDETVSRYIGLSRDASRNEPELTIWPETATPFYFLNDPEPSDRILDMVQDAVGYYLIGSPAFERESGGVRLLNSAFLINPMGETINRYDKAHLVPYGEYVPLKRWMPFLGKMVEEVGDFSPGPSGRVISAGSRNIGVQICFEIVFPDLCRRIVRNRGDLIVNITNDAWYGRTSGPYQHFSQTVFRAVESRRSLVRSANTGISGFIDPAGRVLGRTGLFETRHLTESIPIVRVVSFYSSHGDVFASVAVAITLIFLGRAFLKKRKEKDQMR